MTDSQESDLVMALEKEKSTVKDTIVDWAGPNDLQNPVNFFVRRKWLITISFSLLNAATTFSSSIFSTATEQTAKHFHVGDEVMVLATSLFLLGFVCGPVIFGPLSELYGSLVPLYCGFIAFAVFQIPVAVAQNLETVLVCRFLQGVAGSAAQAITGGALTDFWTLQERGFAVAASSGSLFMGPCLGPIVSVNGFDDVFQVLYLTANYTASQIGSFITESSLGWRWTQWITLILAAVVGVLALVVLPETYHPILLTRKAR